MEIFSISDLHLDLTGSKPMDVFGDKWTGYLEKIQKDWCEKVKNEDLVLIAGDISWAMKLEEFQKDCSWLNTLPGKKVMIRGNHDYWWNSISRIRNILPDNMYVIQNDCLRIENILLCGSRGWTLPERNSNQSVEDKKILNREIIRIEISLKAMAKMRKEEDKVIFLIHYPPFNSTRETNAILELFEKYGVDIVIYGHLHGNVSRARLSDNINNVKYYLTSCDMLDFNLIRVKID